MQDYVTVRKRGLVSTPRTGLVFKKKTNYEFACLVLADGFMNLLLVAMVKKMPQKSCLCALYRLLYALSHRRLECMRPRIAISVVRHYSLF